MTLFDRIGEDYKNAMKSRDKIRIETLRLLRSQLKDARIAKTEELNDEEELQVISNAAKKRKEAAEAFTKAGRQELADKEMSELEIISAYLPAQLGEDEIGRMVEAAIADVGAKDIKDFGKVMGKIMPQVKGRADGGMVQQIVRKKLA